MLLAGGSGRRISHLRQFSFTAPFFKFHWSPVNPLTITSVAILGVDIFANEGEITHRFIPTH